jgi:hypothetical protein
VKRVLLAAPRSFCAGVDRAIEIVERLLAEHGPPVYVRHAIVHNDHVLRRLEKLGAVFVESEDDIPPGAICVLSAHGVAPQVRDNCEQRGLQVVDAVCPLVSKVHAEARRYADSGHLVALVGHRNHVEVIGTKGERAALHVDGDRAARGQQLPPFPGAVDDATGRDDRPAPRAAHTEPRSLPQRRAPLVHDLRRVDHGARLEPVQRAREPERDQLAIGNAVRRAEPDDLRTQTRPAGNPRLGGRRASGNQAAQPVIDQAMLLTLCLRLAVAS